MTSSVGDGDAVVIGVQTGPNQLYTAADPSVPITSLIGSGLTYDGGITDVNSEGSPPATQFFIEKLTLMNGSSIALQGPASKGACQWINFYRNVNLTADGGAGGYMYHVILKSRLRRKLQHPGLRVAVDRRRDLPLLPLPHHPAGDQQRGSREALREPAAERGVAAVRGHHRATLRGRGRSPPARWGGLLVAPPPTISTKPFTNNNGKGTIALAPAVLQRTAIASPSNLWVRFPTTINRGRASNRRRTTSSTSDR